jgi:hypothetical protein
MYYYFMYNRLAFMEHYHMRSNIESAFSMIKGKFGDSVRSNSDTGQVNEALCKVRSRTRLFSSWCQSGVKISR